jgi:ATP-binding cassette subfamily F protein uup
MVAQRGRGVEPLAAPAVGPAPAPPKPATAPQQAAVPAKKRLSPAQIHALQALPARIESLGREIAPLRQALEDPTLYERDRRRFDRFTAALAEKEAALVAAEEEWLALEMLREEIAAG